MSQISRKHLYGPVPSRRLGRSLGVDIVPYKVCSYDCIYCQLGRTTTKTAVPAQLASAVDVLDEIKAWLKAGGSADYITFAGSGEPTLNVELGQMICETKLLTGIPLAVITNGSLLSNPAVREAVAAADVLMPSLDAGTERVFQQINRSEPSIGFDAMVEGLVQTSRQFKGQFWLEIMLVQGFNDSDSELYAMQEIVRRIKPDRLQINSVERPSRSGEARSVSNELLEKARNILSVSAEVITRVQIEPASNNQWLQIEEELVQLLSRRPCNIVDCVAVSGYNQLEIEKHLRILMHKGLIEQIGDEDPYYRATSVG
ncbi:MAG: radical SAM protein [Armatimonadota bacterium]